MSGDHHLCTPVLYLLSDYISILKFSSTFWLLETQHCFLYTDWIP